MHSRGKIVHGIQHVLKSTYTKYESPPVITLVLRGPQSYIIFSSHDSSDRRDKGIDVECEAHTVTRLRRADDDVIRFIQSQATELKACAWRVCVCDLTISEALQDGEMSVLM